MLFEGGNPSLIPKHCQAIGSSSVVHILHKGIISKVLCGYEINTDEYVDF